MVGTGVFAKLTERLLTESVYNKSSKHAERKSVGGSVLAPRVAEVDVDAADGVLRGDDALDALDVGAHDLDIVDEMCIRDRYRAVMLCPPLKPAGS